MWAAKHCSILFSSILQQPECCKEPVSGREIRRRNKKKKIESLREGQKIKGQDKR
jgi:hypothetical protein